MTAACDLGPIDQCYVHFSSLIPLPPRSRLVQLKANLASQSEYNPQSALEYTTTDITSRPLRKADTAFGEGSIVQHLQAQSLYCTRPQPPGKGKPDQGQTKQ